MKKAEICRPSIRLHRDEYDLVKRAASLSGQSVQDFMSNAALVQARKVLEGQQGSREGQGALSVLDSPLLLQQFRMVALGVELQIASLSRSGQEALITEADARIRKWIAEIIGNSA